MVLKKLLKILIVIMIIVFIFFLYNAFMSENNKTPDLNPFKEHSIDESEVGSV